jgi:hypothetical protein
MLKIRVNRGVGFSEHIYVAVRNIASANVIERSIGCDVHLNMVDGKSLKLEKTFNSIEEAEAWLKFKNIGSMD